MAVTALRSAGQTAYRPLTHVARGSQPSWLQTRAELRVLELAADGLIDKEIARDMGIAHRTVRQHWEFMYLRCGHWGRTGLVAAWLRWHIRQGSGASVQGPPDG